MLLKARPGTAPISEADVQKLVAGSVAGLDADGGLRRRDGRGRSERRGARVAGGARVRCASRPGRGRCCWRRWSAGLALLALLATLLLLTARRIAALERAAGAKASPQPGA